MSHTFPIDSDGRWSEPHQRNFRSAFQPIVSLPLKRTVGCEGLLREITPNGTTRTPPEFTGPLRADLIRHIDPESHRLHFASAARVLEGDQWLFVNITAVTIQRPEYARELAAIACDAGLPPHRVVLEIHESGGAEETLPASVDRFREEDFLIALDDFGVGHSNLTRLIHLRPDIVKLDRSLNEPASDNTLLLAQLVKLLHDRGALVVAEGVETHTQLSAAIHANVDFAQGFLLGHPRVVVADDESSE
jgi:EAL domain-containing protein (putative c-di-GMP-specific phosphodiesterase class I)